MAYKDLREFLTRLEKEGELKRIRAEVDWKLEVAAITDRVTKSGGPALLFENVKGYQTPLAINLFGSHRRMCLALEVDSLQEVADRISGYLDFQSPQGLLDKIKMLPKLAEMGSFFPKTVRGGPCKQVINKDNFSLFDFPIIQCWPQDAGRYITFPLVFTKNPDTGKRNVGAYRMQVFDARTTAMHWQTQKHGTEHFRRARKKFGTGKLAVACAIGSDPATVFSAVIPAPPDLDELLFAGFLRRAPVELVKCETVDLEVPANAEIVLEGYVDLNEFRREGPFGDHTGYYSLADDYPVFHITCITHRKDPIYLTTIVGPPPEEDYFMGHAIERILLPIIKLQYPEIVDLHMPAEGIFHNLMMVSIRKSYPGQARKVMNAIWSLGQAMFTKCLVVVDDDVDVHNPREVVWKALCALDPERDIQFTLGPVDTLDHAARLPDFGSKMGIDATRKWPGEGYTRGPWPDEIKMDPEIKRRVAQRWRQLGLD
ncbi:MAG: menaquinone biosynthesis decarboxylase [Terriglobia bacterium]